MLFYLAICVLSFAITWIVRKVAIRKSIMDIPNDRSSHTIPTPRGGGLAVAVAWFIGLVCFFAEGKIEKSLFYALLSGLPLTLIGFADDVFNLKPGVRFLVQFLCAAAALFFLRGLLTLDCGLWTLDYGLFLTPLAFIAIIWSVNLFNFLDGIDGYIGSEIVFIGVSAFALTGNHVGLLLAVATFGFLIWNWPKAKIFMGDVGSTLLGFSVAVLAVYHQNNLSLSIPVWLILTSVFWFDATVTLFRRRMNKEKLSEAHRKHAYQRIVQAGFSHRKTTLWAISLNVIGFGLAWLANTYKTYNLAYLFADIVILFAVLRWIDRKKPFEYGTR
ncbi:MAG TPA: glycosyltransferase family 4 protein [Bacteroidales bacterium]